MPTISNTPRPAYIYDAANDQWVPVGFGPHTHAVTDVTNAFNTTTVTTKGDLVVAAGSNNITRLAAGSNGQTLVADSTTTTGLRWQDSITAGKNGIINGGFDIWQRGTSLTGTNGSTSSYGPDRWNIYCGRAGLTISRQTSGLTGFQYSMRVQRDSGNTSTVDIVTTHALETAESLKYAGQQVTMSFWAKAGANYSATGSILTAQIRTGTGTDQIIWNGYTGTSTIASSNVTLTTSWQRFSITGSAALTATELTILFANAPTGTASTNDWFEITGVQLEVGSVATPFSRAGGSIGGELALCKRYCNNINFSINGKSAYNLLAYGRAKTSTTAEMITNFNVPMRVAPTSVTYSGTILLDNISAAPSITGITINQGGTDMVLINVTISSGLTAHQWCIMYPNNDANANLIFSAEL